MVTCVITKNHLAYLPLFVTKKLLIHTRRRDQIKTFQMMQKLEN